MYGGTPPPGLGKVVYFYQSVLSFTVRKEIKDPATIIKARERLVKISDRIKRKAHRFSGFSQVTWWKMKE